MDLRNARKASFPFPQAPCGWHSPGRRIAAGDKCDCELCPGPQRTGLCATEGQAHALLLSPQAVFHLTFPGGFKLEENPCRVELIPPLLSHWALYKGNESRHQALYCSVMIRISRSKIIFQVAPLGCHQKGIFATLLAITSKSPEFWVGILTSGFSAYYRQNNHQISLSCQISSILNYSLRIHFIPIFGVDEALTEHQWINMPCKCIVDAGRTPCLPCPGVLWRQRWPHPVCIPSWPGTIWMHLVLCPDESCAILAWGNIWHLPCLGWKHGQSELESVSVRTSPLPEKYCAKLCLKDLQSDFVKLL